MPEMNQFIKQEANLYVYPASREEHQLRAPTDQLTIGDLHANPLNLLYSLVHHGVINIAEEYYCELVAIYKEAFPLTEKALTRFREILQSITLNAKTKGRILLIGDELADRGQHDLFILELLKRLHELKLAFKILLSNHGIEFIESYETSRGFNQSFMDHGLSISGQKIIPAWKRKHFQTFSMLALNESIQDRLVEKSYLEDLINRFYKPQLQLLSYTISHDGKSVNIYSHAGIGLAILSQLANRLGVAYEDSTLSELAKTIDGINEQFVLIGQKNKIHELFANRDLNLGDYNLPWEDKHSIERTIWNRDYDDLNRPSIHNGYNCCFIHGHDDEIMTSQHVFSLDSPLGKTLAQNTGPYRALLSSGYDSLTLQRTVDEHSPAQPAANGGPEIAEAAASKGAAGGAGAASSKPNHHTLTIICQLLEQCTACSVYNGYEGELIQFIQDKRSQYLKPILARTISKLENKSSLQQTFECIEDQEDIAILTALGQFDIEMKTALPKLNYTPNPLSLSATNLFELVDKLYQYNQTAEKFYELYRAAPCQPAENFKHIVIGPILTNILNTRTAIIQKLILELEKHANAKDFLEPNGAQLKKLAELDADLKFILQIDFSHFTKRVAALQQPVLNEVLEAYARLQEGAIDSSNLCRRFLSLQLPSPLPSLSLSTNTHTLAAAQGGLFGHAGTAAGGADIEINSVLSP